MKQKWLCLEFTKTVAWAPRDSQGETIPTYADFLNWAHEAGAVDEATARELRAAGDSHPDEAEAVLRRAHAARALIYRVFRTVGDGGEPPPEGIEGLNDLLAGIAGKRRLRKTAAGFAWGWRWEPDRLDLPLALAIWSAAELLTAPEYERVRHCAADDCGWLFIDASPNRSRRWCDMADCGNRAKARRFRRRQGGHTTWLS